MTKDELLDQAASRQYTDRTAVALAKEAPSSSDAARRALMIGKRIRQFDKTFLYAGCLTSAAVAYFFVAHALRNLTTTSADAMGVTALVGLFSIIVSWLPLCAVICVAKAWWANEDTKQMLEPIAGTGQCEYALQHLTRGGDMVAEWRDIAIAERGQVYGLDCKIMEALSYCHSENVARAKWQAGQDKACKTVHGLSDSADSEKPTSPIGA